MCLFRRISDIFQVTSVICDMTSFNPFCLADVSLNKVNRLLVSTTFVSVCLTYFVTIVL